MNLKENCKILQLSLKSWKHMWFVLWLEDCWKWFSYPAVYFSSRGFTSDQLFCVTWRAIKILEAIRLEVVVVWDRATPNRRFLRTHAIENGLNMSEEGFVHWVTNRYDLSRKFFFFSDPPHLIKRVRNDFENSGGHNYTRTVMVSEASIFILCITSQHQKFFYLQ